MYRKEVFNRYDGKSFEVPDLEVKTPDHTHKYYPLRTNTYHLAVITSDDICIGWIRSKTLWR